MAAVEDDRAADHLDRVRALDAPGQGVAGFAGLFGSRLQDLQLQDLPRVESLLDGAHDEVGHAFFANVQDRLQGVRECPEVRALPRVELFHRRLPAGETLDSNGSIIADGPRRWPAGARV